MSAIRSTTTCAPTSRPTIWFDSDFDGSTSGICGGVVCASTDHSSYSAWLLLANAYADIGTWYGFTPYVGAGIGGAHVQLG